MTNLTEGVIMDTDLKDPRGKLRCLQQAEDEKRKGVKNNEIYYLTDANQETRKYTINVNDIACIETYVNDDGKMVTGGTNTK